MRVVRYRPTYVQLSDMIKKASAATVTQDLPDIRHVELDMKEWNNLIRELNEKNGHTNDVPENATHIFFEGTCIRRSQ